MEIKDLGNFLREIAAAVALDCSRGLSEIAPKLLVSMGVDNSWRRIALRCQRRPGWGVWIGT